MQGVLDCYVPDTFICFSVFLAMLILIKAYRLASYRRLANILPICLGIIASSTFLPGNREGKIFVWELQSSPPVLVARFVFVALGHQNLL